MLDENNSYKYHFLPRRRPIVGVRAFYCPKPMEHMALFAHFLIVRVLHRPPALRNKKDTAPKTREIPGFFACLGGQKVHCVFIDTNPLFSVKIIFEPATTHFPGLFGAGMQMIFHLFLLLRTQPVPQSAFSLMQVKKFAARPLLIFLKELCEANHEVNIFWKSADSHGEDFFS